MPFCPGPLCQADEFSHWYCALSLGRCSCCFFPCPFVGPMKLLCLQVKLLNQKARERNGLTSAIKGHTHGLVSSVVMNSTTGTYMYARWPCLIGLTCCTAGIIHAFSRLLCCEFYYKCHPCTSERFCLVKFSTSWHLFLRILLDTYFTVFFSTLIS